MVSLRGKQYQFGLAQTTKSLYNTCIRNSQSLTFFLHVWLNLSTLTKRTQNELFGAYCLSVFARTSIWLLVLFTVKPVDDFSLISFCIFRLLLLQWSLQNTVKSNFSKPFSLIDIFQSISVKRLPAYQQLEFWKFRNIGLNTLANFSRIQKDFLVL